MKSLRQSEKELLLDYFLGMVSPEQKQQAQELLSEHEEAAQFLVVLETTLGSLQTYEVESCPEHLAKATVERLTLAARASQSRLEELLKTEASKKVTTHRSFWANFVEMAAVAATIIIVAGVSFPTLQNARNQYWQTKCSAQLAGISQGMSNYAADHQHSLPNVAMTVGSPWWKVGDQGQENVSNTRHLWLLAKGGYAEPEYFVCPARIQGRALKLDRTQVPKLNDFPSRKYVTYSFRILCRQNPSEVMHGNNVLIADLNPVFETLPDSGSRELNLTLSPEQLTANSDNHRSAGQNVLCNDGSVNFFKTRQIGVSNDDIYTMQNQQTYKGVETPCSSTDAFLAP